MPDPSILADKDRALRHWEENHFDSCSLQENRRLLRQHYLQAQQLGNEVLHSASLLQQLVSAMLPGDPCHCVTLKSNQSPR